jgi:hypothetical protein
LAFKQNWFENGPAEDKTDEFDSKSGVIKQPQQLWMREEKQLHRQLQRVKPASAACKSKTLRSRLP